MESLFARDGRLLDLTLDRYALGDLSADEAATVEAHLAAHPEEQARLDTMQTSALPPRRAPRLRPAADPSPLLARDGRLLDLTLDRHALGDLSADEAATVEAHLAAHPEEQARLEAAQASLVAPLPMLRRAPVAPEEDATEEDLPDNVVLFRRNLWSAAGGLLAAAAAVLLLVNIGGTSTDGYTIRGGGSPALTLEVFRSVGSETPQLHSGQAVRPGDRLALRVGSEVDGELLVLGVDGANSTYPCYPQDSATSVPLAAGPPAQLPAGLTMDATPGTERLVAVRCASPMRSAELQDRLVAAATGLAADAPLPELMEGCAQSEIRLKKELQ